MLDKIREQSSHWAIKIILAVIVLVFVGWGFGAGKMSGPGDNFAAKVNGHEIPLQQFENMYRQRSQQARQQNRLPIDNDAFIMQQVLDTMIEQELLSQYADEAGIYVSAAELADEIQHEPYLVDEKSGAFIGREKYLQFLKDRDLAVADYESDVSRDLRIRKTREFLEKSAKVTADEVKDEFRLRSEKVNLAYVRIDPVTLAASTKTVVISKADVDAWTKTNPGKVETIYAERKTTAYTTPAKAELFQITIRKPLPNAKKDDDSAAAAKRRSDRAMETAKDDFKKAADQYSEGAPWEKSGTAREVSRRELASTVADKVFAMKPGDPAELVETPTAYEIVKVKSITPEKVTDLDETLKRAIVEDEIRKERATDEVEKFAKDALARLQKGESLDKIAASKTLQVKETGAYPHRDEIPGIPEATPAIVGDSFKLAKPGDVLLSGGGAIKSGSGYVLAVLKEHQMPKDDDFDKQKHWIEAGLQRNRGAMAFAEWKSDQLAKAKIVENPRYAAKSS